MISAQEVWNSLYKNELEIIWKSEPEALNDLLRFNAGTSKTAKELSLDVRGLLVPLSERELDKSLTRTESVIFFLLEEFQNYNFEERKSRC